MRRCTTAIALSLLTVLWTAAPLLACKMPGRTMTAQEHPYCKCMAHMSESGNMPQSHACCQTEVRSGSTMVATSKYHAAPQLHLIATLTDSTKRQSPERLLATRPHHPPGEFLPETTVLRI